MKYINPFNTLGIQVHTLDISDINEKYVRKLKKQYLTEFELLDTVTITINNQEFDKNSVLQLFDNLMNEAVLQYHFEIFQDKPLLDFLENGNFNLFYQDKIQELQQKDDNFKRFIAPYFAEQYSQLLLKNVKGRRLHQVKMMARNPLPIPFEFESNCFQPTYRYLKVYVRDIRNIFNQNFSEKLVHQYLTPSLIDILNALPVYFIGIRNDLAEIIEAVALQLNNKERKFSHAKRLLKLGLKLKMDAEMKYRLQYVLDQFNKYPQEYWGKGDPDDKPYQMPFLGRYGRFALFICIWLLIRLLVGC